MGSKTADKSVHKTIGWLGVGIGTNPATIDVKNGRIARIRPFRWYDKYTKEETRHWQLNVRGHVFDPGDKAMLPPLAYGYKKRIYSRNRIPFPLKRVDWEPGGDPEKINPQNRGKSKYKRISWDEATDIIASEIRRIYDTYGSTALFVQADGHGEEKNIGGGHGAMTRFLDVLGKPFTLQARQPDSWEGWYWGAKHAWGMDPVGKQAYQGNLFKDISENSQGTLFWGCDVDSTPWGWGGQTASRMCYYWTELGIKQIYICPDVNYACAVHADKWMPILPNTDAAMQLAIAYTWIMEGTYDREYVDSHTIGFENFANYVLGGEDGEPKTPKWAEGKCGVPSRQIKALARYWAQNNISIVHCNGGGTIRSVYSHEPARLEVCLLAMQALGHPGRNQMQMLEWGLFGYHSLNPMPPAFENLDVSSVFSGHQPGAHLKKYFIPQTLVPRAITSPPVEWYGQCVSGLPRANQFLHFEYPADDGQRIHMFWTDTPCWETCWNGGFRLQDALRDETIETVVCHHIWMENDVFFADIILPISTKYEEEDILTSTLIGQHEMVVNELQAIDHVGESLGDFDCALAIADKFGLREATLRYVCGLEFTDRAEHGTVKNAVKGEGVEGDTHNEPITIDYMKHLAWTAGGFDKYFDYDKFEENGYWIFPTLENWEDEPAGMIEYYNDPSSLPLDTPSHLIEMYATGIAEHWPDDNVRGPIPKWIEEDDLHHERLTNDRGIEYPFLLVSNHPHFRIHAEHDDSVWLREIEMCKVVGPDGYKYEPVWINPVDARPRGIETGDVVRVFNERGGVLGGAIVTERIMPKSLSQDHGARVDTIIRGKGGLDRGGANNLIAPGNTSSKNAVGEVTNGFLVNIEKVDIFQLARENPEEFGREYNPADGPQPSSRIIDYEVPNFYKEAYKEPDAEDEDGEKDEKPATDEKDEKPATAVKDEKPATDEDGEKEEKPETDEKE